MSDQLEFDLFGEEKPASPPAAGRSSAREPEALPPKPKPKATQSASASPAKLKRRHLQRAVMGWLLQAGAGGIAAQVPTRISRYKADVAAFWSAPVRRRTEQGPARILRPVRTVVVELRRTRKECWPDCANSEELTPRLTELREQQERLQEQIREDEPGLQRTDMLFEEFADWEYNLSGNEDYHAVCREIRKIEKALYRGTKFEALAGAGLADEAYLAVPAGTVRPPEVASGWGLLWVSADFSIEVLEAGPRHACTDDNRLHVVQNIGQASRDSVLFANGIYRTADGPAYLPIPRRRRPKA